MEPFRIQKIAVGIDFSDDSLVALRHAMDLAGAVGASVEAVHVAAGEGADVDFATRAELDSFIARVASGSAPDVVLRHGDPRRGLVDHATSSACDLLVVGTFGRTGRAHALAGSVAEGVVRTASCPVLVVKAPRQPRG